MVNAKFKVIDSPQVSVPVLGFRAKFWNVTINLFGVVLVIWPAMLIDLALLPIGLFVGVVTDKYPSWAKAPLTHWVLPKFPTEDEGWNNRPFYRPR